MKKLRQLLPFCRCQRRCSGSGVLHVRKLTSTEIKKATDGFNMILGSDSDGDLYKAQFADGFVAAIRKLKPSEQSKDTFRREVLLLARLHHRHLVKVVGFSQSHERFLAYEHMENGSLRDWLHDPLKTPLNWRTRLQIAVDVAAALEYIYYFCDPPMYNVTINSSNVLLDENFVAKLSSLRVIDFSSSQANELNAICSRDELDQRKRDALFQYGLLILELVTGQSMDGGDELLRWVQGSGFTYSLHKMVDADLGGNYDSRELRSLLIIARLCTKIGHDPLVSITQILRYLQGKMDPSLP